MEKTRIVVTGLGGHPDISGTIYKVLCHQPPPKIPRSEQWLGRCWPPADFPTLGFEYDTYDEMESSLRDQKELEERRRNKPSNWFGVTGCGVWSYDD